MASRNASPRATVMAFRFLGEASVTILTVVSCESFSTAHASTHVHVETGVRGIIYGGRGRGPCVQHVPSLLYRERWPMTASSGDVGREKAQPCAVPCAALAHSGRASYMYIYARSVGLVIAKRRRERDFVGRTRCDSSHPRVFNTVNKRIATPNTKAHQPHPTPKLLRVAFVRRFRPVLVVEICHVLSCLQELRFIMIVAGRRPHRPGWQRKKLR